MQKRIFLLPIFFALNAAIQAQQTPPQLARGAFVPVGDLILGVSTYGENVPVPDTVQIPSTWTNTLNNNSSPYPFVSQSTLDNLNTAFNTTVYITDTAGNGSVLGSSPSNSYNVGASISVTINLGVASFTPAGSGFAAAYALTSTTVGGQSAIVLSVSYT